MRADSWSAKNSQWNNKICIYERGWSYPTGGCKRVVSLPHPFSGPDSSIPAPPSGFMIADNQWHEGILYEKPDGTFVLVESIEEAIEDAKRLNSKVKYQKCKYNWNNGQPMVDFDDGVKMTIVDVNMNKPQDL